MRVHRRRDVPSPDMALEGVAVEYTLDAIEAVLQAVHDNLMDYGFDQGRAAALMLGLEALGAGGPAPVDTIGQRLLAAKMDGDFLRVLTL